MLMLMIKVTKNNLDVISGIIHGTTNIEEEIWQMIKMKKQVMDVVNNLNNLVKTVAKTIIPHQVKLVFKCNTNPMLWLAVEDLLTHLKPQEMKASDLAEGTWKMKRTCMASSSSTCPSSKVKTMPRPTSHGHSRSTRSSAYTTTPVPRKWPWRLLNLKTMPTLGGNKYSL